MKEKSVKIKPNKNKNKMENILKLGKKYIPNILVHHIGTPPNANIQLSNELKSTAQILLASATNYPQKSSSC